MQPTTTNLQSRETGKRSYAGQLKISRAMASESRDVKMAATSILYCVFLFQCLWSVSWSAKKASSSAKATSVVTLDIEHSFDSVHFTKR